MYQLSELGHLYQDFEPYIDTHTMGIHYYKHMKNYLDKLNMLLNKNNYNFKDNLNDLLYHVGDFPINDRENILFNLGGVLNHNLYWKSINSKKYLPQGNLKNMIDSKYGDFEGFWDSFKNKALELKGSGYTFLIANKEGELDIVNTFNQDTPLTNGDIPLFNIDLWEHAYYLSYQNDKERYIDNFKEIVSFKYAGDLYEKIVTK